MEILKHGKDGVAACNVEVSQWDELPPLGARDGVALCCSGTCLRCQRDMDEQLKDQTGAEDRGQIVAKRSEENHMDPCFRFPWDDLKDLFASATVVEAMLVALEHMQVSFVTISSGFTKFRRNTLSFPQDIVGFAGRLQLMKNYRPGDRVNSSRGPGVDRFRVDREVVRATAASAEERDKYAVDQGGALIFPARVLEVGPDGVLVLEYDGGVQGYERAEDVTPRLAMPWHPRDVPLHLMLRRNIGRGRGALEGLQVRWWKIAQILQALCACPRNGYGPWRLGGGEEEPMHKFYDPKMFHMMSEEEMKLEYAPKVVDGVVVGADEVGEMSVEEKLTKAVGEVGTTEEFMAAGFDVNFVGPDGVGPAQGGGGAMDREAGEGAGEDGDVDESGADGRDRVVYVDEETFGVWCGSVDSREFRFGSLV